MKMRELALLAGVSVSSVSKAFSGSREISIDTKERIIKIAKETGCYEKYSKKSFSKKVIAVVCYEFASGYYANQLKFLEREIAKRGGIMIASTCNFDHRLGAELVRYYAEYLKADGIIIFGSRQLFKKYDVPIVVIGESEEYDSVWLSNERAIEDAVELFLEKGHKRIAFIGESLTESKSVQFINAMEKNGQTVNDEYIMNVPERFEEAGYKAMNHLLSLKNPPTAVLAAYDNIALGAMRSIRERGLKIPEDISIIGMDDIKECEYFDVPLTSVTSYIEDLCEIVADMIFARIKSGKMGNPKKIKVSTELVKRGSVGECKK